MTISVNGGPPQEISVARNPIFSETESATAAAAAMQDEESTAQDVIVEIEANIADARKPRRYSVMFNSNDTNWLPQLWMTFATHEEAFTGMHLLNTYLRSTFARFGKTWVTSNAPEDADKPPVFELPGTEPLGGGVILPEAERGPPSLQPPPVLTQLDELTRSLQAGLDRSFQRQMAAGGTLQLKQAPTMTRAVHESAGVAGASNSDEVDV